MGRGGRNRDETPANGKGQVGACEVCIMTPAIRKVIRDGESHLMVNEIQMGKKYQMQSMDMALLELYQRGEITYDTAMSAARDQNQFRHKTE
jgi:twitching motility protein PilT